MNTEEIDYKDRIENILDFLYNTDIPDSEKVDTVKILFRAMLALVEKSEEGGMCVEPE